MHNRTAIRHGAVRWGDDVSLSKRKIFIFRGVVLLLIASTLLAAEGLAGLLYETDHSRKRPQRGRRPARGERRNRVFRAASLSVLRLPPGVLRLRLHAVQRQRLPRPRNPARERPGRAAHPRRRRIHDGQLPLHPQPGGRLAGPGGATARRAHGRAGRSDQRRPARGHQRGAPGALCLSRPLFQAGHRRAARRRQRRPGAALPRLRPGVHEFHPRLAHHAARAAPVGARPAREQPRAGRLRALAPGGQPRGDDRPRGHHEHPARRGTEKRRVHRPRGVPAQSRPFDQDHRRRRRRAGALPLRARPARAHARGQSLRQLRRLHAALLPEGSAGRRRAGARLPARPRRSPRRRDRPRQVQGFLPRRPGRRADQGAAAWPSR